MRRLADEEKCIAKVIEQVGEKNILEYLRQKDPLGRHVIFLLDTSSTNLGRVIVLPVRYSVKTLLSNSKAAYRGTLVHIAEELMEGVAFLYSHDVAHLDLKPENFVYDDALQAQLIDFDTAVKVKGVDEYITDDVGTNEYRAPETFTKDESGALQPYKPILADRWSLGINIRDFLDTDPEGDVKQRRVLMDFSQRLMDTDPERRIPLTQWRKHKEAESAVVSVTPQKRRRIQDEDSLGVQQVGPWAKEVWPFSIVTTN